MARPDIKKERTEQILDAFEVCVARYGVDGATLARTAEIAGLARPLVRHNVGNRDALLSALVNRFLKDSRARLDDFIAALPTENRIQAAIDGLFEPDHSDAQIVQVANALIAAAADDDALAAKMQVWLNDFASRLGQLIAEDYPDADTSAVSAAAAGITGIYFNLEALYALGDLRAFSAASKTAAKMLIESLE